MQRIRGEPGASAFDEQAGGAYSEESADVLPGILESADDPFAAVDPGFRLVAFNAAFRRWFDDIYGTVPSLNETIAQALIDFPNDRASLLDLCRRAFAGEAFRLVHEFAGRAGQRSFYDLSLSPVMNPAGKPVTAVLMLRDVTERRGNEQKFRGVLEAAPDATLVVSRGVIEFANSRTEKMFGYAPGTLAGRSLEILLPERFRESHVLERTAFEKAPKTRPMGSRLDLWGLRADGSEFPVEISLSPLEANGEQFVVAAVRDVSTRRRTEDELRQQCRQLQQELRELRRGIAIANPADEYRVGFEKAAAGLFHYAPDGRFRRVNEHFCRMLGYSCEDLLQLTVQGLTHPDDAHVNAQLDCKLLAGLLNRYSVDKRLLRSDGQPLWVRMAVAPQRDAHGDPEYLIGVAEDISFRKQTEQELREAQLRQAMTAEIAKVGYCEIDLATYGAYFSPEWKRQLGYDDPEMPSSFGEWKLRLHPEDREPVTAAVERLIDNPKDTLNEEYRLRHKDGNFRWFLGRMMAIEDVPGHAKKLIGTQVDITDRKESERRIREVALHDALTQLPNRALLFEYLEHILSGARRTGRNAALLFVDLDRFKAINDTYGHEVGDGILRGVALRLQASIRREDVVGRLGGDEFLVVLGNAPDAARAESVARHILDELNQVYPVKGLELSLSPSIGIALFPHDGDTPDLLLRNADRAMYRAKQSGRNTIQFFTAEMEQQVAAANALENQLKSALARDEFELYYQALVDLHTRRVHGAEALLRWHRHPGEIVLPKDFVPVAESLGIIRELGDWVLASACRQQRQWQDEGLPPISVAVNVSPVQFRQKEFQARLAALISDSHIDPAFLNLEVTESALMQDIDEAGKLLGEMKKLGVKISLDDIGTGFSSLSYLSRLPLDTVKIDRAFMQTLGHDTGSAAIAEAVIALGRALKLEIIAEGIESEDALIYVRDRDCTLAQGFHLAPPMSAENFGRWMREKVAA